MIDGGLFNPERTEQRFDFRDLELAVDEHGVDALNAIAREVAAQPGVTVYRTDSPFTGPGMIVVRERLVPTITALGKEPTP